MDYRIYIPTRGRARRDLQYTAVNLGLRSREKASLVVRPDEEEAYRPLAEELGVGLIVRPGDCENLSQTLDWIIHSLADPDIPCIMADDDLRFSIRINEESAALRLADHEDVDNILQDLANQVLNDGSPMSGISARFGNNNRYPHRYQFCGRQMQIHCVLPRFFRHYDIRPADVVTKSDFHMTLSVLEQGYRNAILCYATVDQAKGSNSAGGVGIYRTLEVMEQGAKRLAELHPGYVKLVQKENSNWKGLEAQFRTDVQIAWKKAWTEGCS